MSLKQNCVRIFISYARKDLRHREALEAHLGALQKGKKEGIFWHDGLIEPGKDWERSISEALKQSDIVIALVTSNFFKSNYCVDEELAAALVREKKGECDLVPVLAEPCDYPAHWIGKLQMLPGSRAVTEYALRAKGWKIVAEGIRNKVESLMENRPALQTLGSREEIVHSGLRPLDESEKRTGCQEFENVSAFWRARPQLDTMGFATVQATLSRFAPLVMGPPGAKRRLHKEFRQALETNRALGKRKSLTIDACMSVSSGQMVVRETLEGKPKLLLGLYSSIVRNSIPVFVKREYYERVVEPLFNQYPDTESFEARVTGRVFRLDNSFIRRFLVRQHLDKILLKKNVDDLCENAFALEVGDEETGISARLEPTHCLDGDIWLAIRKPDGSDRFMTSFLDITNAQERDEEFQFLKELADRAGAKVFVRYDQIPSLEDFSTE